MIERDIETGEILNPVYIVITCSKDSEYTGKVTDFSSNTLASRINVSTFNKCWTDIFYNENDGLEKIIMIPEEDENVEKENKLYLVWSVTKKPQTNKGEVEFLTPTLNRTYVGLINQDCLKQYLPKTLENIQQQKIHFGIGKSE